MRSPVMSQFNKAL